jgi:hypothetical protein
MRINVRKAYRCPFMTKSLWIQLATLPQFNESQLQAYVRLSLRHEFSWTGAGGAGAVQGG